MIAVVVCFDDFDFLIFELVRRLLRGITLVSDEDKNNHNIVQKPKNSGKSFLVPVLIFLGIFQNQYELQVAIVVQMFKLNTCTIKLGQAQI